MSNWLTVPAAILLVFVFTYLLIRFGSAAFYRSKREFMEWYELVHRRKGDNKDG